MPVVLRHNDELELNRVEYHGSVTLAEIVALAQYNAEHPTSLTYDSLSLVLPGAHFRTIEKATLDNVFAQYRTLFEPLTFLILRRSAWICQSPAAEEHVAHWLGGRDTRQGMSTDTRKFDGFAEAGAWLILNPREIGQLERGDGFNEIVRYSIAAAGPAR